MKLLVRVAAGLIAAAMATAAPAQLGTDGEKFVGMVRDGDNGGALALLESKPIIIDFTDSRGDSALIVAVRNRDPAWTAHLLKAGADPNLAARNGDTPLILAARGGFTEAARWLIGVGAKVDGANRRGETALIVAVQERHAPVVRLLLSAGADPDRTDAAAGFSARDYARRETRFPELLTAIEASPRAGQKAAKPASDKLDDFKLN
jgi:ankyrin repeat protein